MTRNFQPGHRSGTGQVSFRYIPPPDRGLDILYEDAALVALDKPSGLLSVPGRGVHLEDCLHARLQKRYPSALVIHRLDMDTSGILLFALDGEMQRAMSALFAAREIEKRYSAWVAGEMEATSGEIDLPLLTDWPNRPRQKVDVETGKPALTSWQLEEVRDGASRLTLKPETGRSHQLRVHLAAIGHPILGDPLYAEGAARAAADRLQLHAEGLAFTHPKTGARVEMTASSPLSGP